MKIAIDPRKYRRRRVHGEDVQVHAADPLLEEGIEDQEQGDEGDDRGQATETDKHVGSQLARGGLAGIAMRNCHDGDL